MTTRQPEPPPSDESANDEEDFSTDTYQPCVLGPDGRCIRWLHIHYYAEADVPEEVFPKIVSREVVGSDWRCTWYERADGSRFSVAIPLLKHVKSPYNAKYDEDAEAQMRDQLL